MNSNKIEQISVDSINREINKHNLLDTYVKSKDKEPSWDGHIYVYKNENMNVNSIEGRVPVQVKGEEVKEFSGKDKKYNVKIADLKNYQKEGIGVLFFVVEIINSETTKIYYRELLPLDLNIELRNIRKNQVHRKIKFKELSQEEHSSLYYICRNFLNNSNQQKGKIILSKEEIKNVKDITFDIVTKKDNLEEYILNNPIYFYGRIEGEKELIPLEKVDCFGLAVEFKGTITAGSSKIFYNKYKILRTKDNYVIYIGKSIQIDKKEKQLIINIKGNIYERLYDLEFITELSKTQTLQINDGKFTFGKLKKKENLFKNIQMYQDLKQVFDKLGMFFNIPLERLNKEDFDNLNKLINLAKNQNFVNTYIKETGIYEIRIGKMKIAFFGYRQGTSCVIFDLFSDIYNYFCLKEVGEDGKIYTFCLYCNLTEKQLLEYTNIKFDMILKAFKSIKMYDRYATLTNNFLLNSIKIYDKTKNINFLNLAEKLNNLLLEYEDSAVNKINKFQIIARKRKFNIKEIEEIINLKKDIDNNLILYAISILLHSKEEIKYYEDKLSKTEFDNIKKYPIYNLISTPNNIDI